MKKLSIKRSTYYALATCLSSFAVMTVVVASLFYVYNPKPPKELMK